jgi:hypothetical protein
MSQWKDTFHSTTLQEDLNKVEVEDSTEVEEVEDLVGEEED